MLQSKSFWYKKISKFKYSRPNYFLVFFHRFIFLLCIDASLKDRCINNNNVRTPNGNHYSNQPNIFVTNIAATAPINTKGQHQSNAVTMPAPEDGSVLKKVISFTFDQTNNVDCMTEKATRPSFVPEKLHFSAYEQFKGKLMFKIRIYCDVYT